MKINDYVKILRPGDYKGETGQVINIYEMTDGGKIIEVSLDHDFLYDPTVNILVWERELELNQQK